MTNTNDLLQYVQNDAFGNWLFPGYKTVNPVKYELKREAQHTHLACSAGVFFERAICSRKRHVETSRREEEMGRVKGLLLLLSPIFHCHKIKDGGYTNITSANKVSPTQNTPALQASKIQKTQDAYKFRMEIMEITSSINSRVRLRKINHSGPGCSFYEFYEWYIFQ